MNNKRFFTLLGGFCFAAQNCLLLSLPSNAESIQLQLQQPKIDTSLEPVHLQGRIEQMVSAHRGDKLPLELVTEPPKPKPVIAAVPTLSKVVAKKNEPADTRFLSREPKTGKASKPLSGAVSDSTNSLHAGTAVEDKNKPLQAATSVTEATKPLKTGTTASVSQVQLNKAAAATDASKTAKVALSADASKATNKAPAPKVTISAQERKQIPLKSFAGQWGGDLIITSRVIYISDGGEVRLDTGDSGSTMVRVVSHGPSQFYVQPPTVFFAKPQYVTLSTKQAGPDSNSPNHIRYVFVGGAFGKLHDGYGNRFTRTVLHNSIKRIGPDAIEADMVVATVDSTGNINSYDERVVRLFKNSEYVVYAKFATAKYDRDRTLMKQTLSEGWLSLDNPDTVAKIGDITGQSWDQLNQQFEL